MENKINNVLFFLVLFVFSGPAVNAQKCRYSYNKFDVTTNEQVRNQKIIIGSNFGLEFYRRADNYRVRMYVTLNSRKAFTVPAGHPMNIKLGNGELIELKNSTDWTPERSINRAAITEYRLSFICSEEQMEQIAEFGFRLVSIMLREESINVEPKKNEFEANKHKAACLLKD